MIKLQDILSKILLEEKEKRAKYPACRPTPAGCKTKGKGKKWGKTK